MRAFGIVFALTLAAASATAQQPAPQAANQAMKAFASSSDVTAIIAKAKSDRKGDQPVVVERILQLAPYSVNLEYRPGIGPGAIHPDQAELFYVISGSATLMTGGKLVKETNPVSVEGGATQEVAKGDFIIIPEGTPHWFTTIHETLILMSLHVPRSSAATSTAR